MRCIQCETAEAAWIRHTQFAGKHPYCDSCARKEPDFGGSDSTFDWARVKGDDDERARG